MKSNLKEQYIVGLTLAMVAFLFLLLSDKSREYIWSDAEGYYMYLPALTLYGFSDLPVRTVNQFSKIESTGRFYDKYTSGVAIIQAPFYALASLYAAVSKDFEVNGYSKPFQHSILWAALFYAFSGLFILYKVLRRDYSLFVVVAGLICLFFGTNLLYYTYREPGMAHVYAFFLWTLVLWRTPKIYENASWKNFFILALIVGLLVFIRPSNAVAAIFILFYNLPNLRERIKFIANHILKFGLLLIPISVLSILQVLMWKHMLGETVLFSYNSEPGFIYFASPKIMNVLFHVHNGLFIYAPVLLFALIGLITGIIHKKKNFILLAVILFISTYIFASWWAWWFGGAYGHRCYVDLLPLLAIPLVYVFDIISKSRLMAIKGLTILIAALFIYYSIHMTVLYRSPWDGPGFGWKEYWAIVDKMF